MEAATSTSPSSQIHLRGLVAARHACKEEVARLGDKVRDLLFSSEASSDNAPRFWLNGAAQESNLPSLGLPDLTGFEDRLGHRAHAAPEAG